MTKKIDAELKSLSKLNNVWKFFGHMYKFRMKELLLSLCIILLSILIMKANGVKFDKLFKFIGGLF
ncbi:MAG: hypothetical protein GY870_21965 [archaeon]|nr:hypothetical protein [archaeon]